MTVQTWDDDPLAGTRGVLLAAGRAWLCDRGVTASPRGLSLAELARRADVPLPAARQAWPCEADFVSDVMCHLAGPECFGSEAFDSQTLDIGLAVLREHDDLLGTARGRRAVIGEAIRQAVPRNLSATIASPHWRLYLALVAAAPSMPDDRARQRIATALHESVAGFVRRMSQFYAGLADLLTLRFRHPAYRFEHVTTAGAALVEGFALRQLLADAYQPGDSQVGGQAGGAGAEPSLHALLGDPLPGPGVRGGEASWTLLALAFDGLVDTFFDLEDAACRTRPR